MELNQILSILKRKNKMDGFPQFVYVEGQDSIAEIREVKGAFSLKVHDDPDGIFRSRPGVIILTEEKLNGD